MKPIILLGASPICLDVNCGVAREGALGLTGGHGTTESASGTDVLDSRAQWGCRALRLTIVRVVQCPAGPAVMDRSVVQRRGVGGDRDEEGGTATQEW